MDFPVSSQAKPPAQRLILAGVVALAVLLLLLRLFVFAHGRERHRFHGAAIDSSATRVRAASYLNSPNWPFLPWASRFVDGPSGFLRLAGPATLDVVP
jgi:hypothetical protein